MQITEEAVVATVIAHTTADIIWIRRSCCAAFIAMTDGALLMYTRTPKQVNISKIAGLMGEILDVALSGLQVEILTTSGVYVLYPVGGVRKILNLDLVPGDYYITVSRAYVDPIICITYGTTMTFIVMHRNMGTDEITSSTSPPIALSQPALEKPVVSPTGEYCLNADHLVEFSALFGGAVICDPVQLFALFDPPIGASDQVDTITFSGPFKLRAELSGGEIRFGNFEQLV